MRRRLLIILGAFILVTLGAATAYERGWWVPNYPKEKDFAVRGIDVSAHQGEVQWREVSASGVSFAYLKATEGGGFRDKQFARNWAETGKVGLLRGAYHFYTMATPGTVQAANFIATVPREQGTLPPVIDLEYWGNSAYGSGVSARLAGFRASGKSALWSRAGVLLRE